MGPVSSCKCKLKEKTSFYGYINLVACTIMFVALNVASACFSQFITPVSEELGCTRAEFSLTNSFFLGTLAVMLYFYGPLVRKFGIKRLLLVGFTMQCIGFGIYSISQELWQFYIGGIIQGIGGAWSLAVPMNAIITNWFIKNRGLAVGALTAATGVSGMIFNPIVANLIVTSGWRPIWGYMAVIAFVICLISWLFIRVHPSELGQTALGETGDAGIKADVMPSGSEGMTAKDAVRTKQFVILVFASFLAALSCQGLFYQISPNIVDNGYGAVVSGFALALVYGAQGVGELATGVINDKYGNGAMLISILVTMLGCTVCFLVLSSEIWIYTGSLLYGFAMSIFSVPLPLIVAAVFGTKEYADISGKLSTPHWMGAAFGSTVIAMIYDATGSYNIGIIAMAAICVISFGLYFWALSSKSKRNNNA